MINKKKIIIVFTLLLGGALMKTFAQSFKYPFQNPKLDVEERVKDLVSRMTLDEKISQMMYQSPAIERLGIPSYNWWNECLHGVARAGQATVFPQGIGMAAAFDDELMFRIADAISDEARAKHHDFVRQGKRGIYQGLTFWTPNINIFRDPRWGRGQETYGEDPFLAGKLAVQFVKGLQGNDPHYLKTIATIKHFAVHSGPEPLRHEFDAETSEKDLIETYLPAFKEVVEKTNVGSVMCAYNRFRGEACCGSSELLQEYLRKRWGFSGYVVSDCGAIRDFYTDHKITASAAEAAALAVKRGTDLNCGVTYRGLREAVERNLITEQEIDQSVMKLFRARFKLGMFDADDIVPYAKLPMSVVDSDRNRQIALEAAHKSVVLLKNDGILPLKKSIKKIAVIGPTANDEETLWGNYCGYNKNGVTVLQGIRNKIPEADIRYEVGCELSENFPQIEPIPADYLFTDVTGKQNGVRSAYYNNPNLWGNPKHTLIEKEIDNIWWDKAPYSDMPADNFGAVYETFVRIPETGRYALGMEGFYGYKFFVNDSLTFQYGNVHHPRKNFYLRSCKAGEMIKIRIEYRHEIVNHALIKLLWGRADNKVLMKRAIAAARKSDIVILCMGINQNLEGEEMTVKSKGFAGGDRTEIDLPDTQKELVAAICDLKKPVVLVLQNGSPLSITVEHQKVNAVVEGWYGGQSAGTALADILLGDYNPSGRLPVTVYKSLEQLPGFEDYGMQGRTYRYFSGDPLYEFGYGLSYTSFRYTNLQIPIRIATNDPLEFSVDVTNTGNMDGDEVVQVYISHEGLPFVTPIRSLKGFKRVSLKKGETKTIRFLLESDDLSVVKDDGRVIVMPCTIKMSVGGKQPDMQSLKQGTVVEKNVDLVGDPVNL
ncbi:glycoside hydrolase family 3 C-terminal domain-containing protein [Bacteroides cellulosilyticus]|uniref:glycoside hydrolase family 3 C-terminal domain-containing protein n=1 Tax=Bacteroides cellulosilyticus TaxID=246787 RepID=UPI0018A06855|nr:glycoside hydrolase family 3 C-terminal domain-containing protein [Bacteroides cellulosilyticus]